MQRNQNSVGQTEEGIWPKAGFASIDINTLNM